MQICKEGMMFLGLNSFSSQKDPMKKYYQITLGDPPGSMEVFVEPQIASLAVDIPPYSLVDVNFSIESGRSGFRVGILDIKLAEMQTPLTASSGTSRKGGGAHD